MTEAIRHRRKLKNYLINPRFQLRYVLFLNLIGFFMFITAGTCVYYGIRHHLLRSIPDTAVVESVLSLTDIFPLLIGLFCLFAFVISLLGIYFSHRTAGPLYRFRMSFEDVGDGNRELRIRLRPNDDFQEVAQAFNQMMDQLHDKDSQS